MRIRLEFLLGDKTDALLTFEFTDWQRFRNFLQDWFEYCQAKQIKAKITVSATYTVPVKRRIEA